MWLEFVWSLEIVNSSFYVWKLMWEIFILNRSKTKALCAGNIKAEFQIAVLDFTGSKSNWRTVTNLICIFSSCRKFNKKHLLAIWHEELPYCHASNEIVFFGRKKMSFMQFCEIKWESTSLFETFANCIVCITLNCVIFSIRQ